MTVYGVLASHYMMKVAWIEKDGQILAYLVKY